MKKLCILASLIFFLSIPFVQARREKSLLIGLVDECPKRDVSSSPAYVNALVKGGHLPLVIPYMTDAKALKALVKKLDMVILTGGEDVNPSCYNAQPSPLLGGVNDRRDSFEFLVLAEAVKQKKPIFGTCRGMQMLNVYFGGTLYQDLPTERPGQVQHNGGNHCHSVMLTSGSRLAEVLGVDTLIVNTYHHQSAFRMAPGFRVTAMAPDGVVEAMECDSLPVAAVQFHPESLIGNDSIFLYLYRHLLEITGK